MFLTVLIRNIYPGSNNSQLESLQIYPVFPLGHYVWKDLLSYWRDKNRWARLVGSEWKTENAEVCKQREDLGGMCVEDNLEGHQCLPHPQSNSPSCCSDDMVDKIISDICVCVSCSNIPGTMMSCRNNVIMPWTLPGNVLVLGQMRTKFYGKNHRLLPLNQSVIVQHCSVMSLCLGDGRVTSLFGLPPPGSLPPTPCQHVKDAWQP